MLRVVLEAPNCGEWLESPAGGSGQFKRTVLQ